jgi:RNA polymerase sigma-70 factor (ECF subfamily)
VEILSAGSSVAPTAIEEMSAGEIKKCVDELPVGYKTIFNLHAVEGYSYTEIAEIMNISESTTRSQYLRARGKLVEIMNRRFMI